jgi:hydroxyacylglutathione hydrolase
MPITIQTLPLGPLQANCYLVTSDLADAALAIDPGGPTARVQAALRRARKRLTHILLTHAHFDHIGGVAELARATGAALGLHAADLPLLNANGEAEEFGLSLEPCPPPALLITPPQALEVGAVRLQALHVPGHTPGHLAFYVPEAKSVFTGDVLFQRGVGRTDLPGGDADALMRSIREVLFLLPDDTRVYPGHGPATTIGDEKQFNPFVAE